MSFENLIDDKIKNATPERRKELIEYAKKNNIASISEIREAFGISVSANKTTIRYWTDRGYDRVDANRLRAKLKYNRISPFNKDHWLQKGYSEEDAIFKARACRPIFKEYWIQKGYSEEESILFAKEKKEKNNKKGAKASSSIPIEERYKASPRRKEYWISLGYTDEEAGDKVSETQSTFSLEKCIEKHGERLGREIWQNRQDRWQETLKNKSPEEIEEINMKKRYIDYNEISKTMTDEEIKKHLARRGMKLFITMEEFEDEVARRNAEDHIWKYRSKEEKINSFSKMQIDMLEITEEFFEEPEKSKMIKSSFGFWTMKTEEGYFLKSSYEIEFYHMIKDIGLKFTCNKMYPDNKRFYDFYLIDHDIYIEISPLYKKDEDVTKIVDMKKERYGSVILTNSREMREFINGYI